MSGPETVLRLGGYQDDFKLVPIIKIFFNPLCKHEQYEAEKMVVTAAWGVN